MVTLVMLVERGKWGGSAPGKASGGSKSDKKELGVGEIREMGEKIIDPDTKGSFIVAGFTATNVEGDIARGDGTLDEYRKLNKDDRLMMRTRLSMRSQSIYTALKKIDKVLKDKNLKDETKSAAKEIKSRLEKADDAITKKIEEIRSFDEQNRK